MVQDYLSREADLFYQLYTLHLPIRVQDLDATDIDIEPLHMHHTLQIKPPRVQVEGRSVMELLRALLPVI